VSQPIRLNDADRARFSDAVEASFGVSSRQQFFVWSQSSVQSLVPHEILICGIEDGSRQGMAMHRFSASRYFKQEHFDIVSDPLAGLMPRLMAVAEGNRTNIIFSPYAEARVADDDLLALVTDNELKNLAAQMVMGTRGTEELGGPLRIAAKDLRSYGRVAEAAGSAIPVAQAASQVLRLALNQGHAEVYLSALGGVLAGLNGTAIRHPEGTAP
jgi:hypothetical protein